MKKYLLSKEDKKLFFKLKLKSKLDKSYILALRAFLREKGVDECIYTDDDIIYALVKGKLATSCLK